jgi:hypothetical protein
MNTSSLPFYTLPAWMLDGEADSLSGAGVSRRLGASRGFLRDSPAELMCSYMRILQQRPEAAPSTPPMY